MSVDSGYSHRGTCHLHTERPRVGFKTRILLLWGNSENHCRMMTERLKQMNICWLVVSCGFNSMSCAVVLLVLSPGVTASSWFPSLYSKDQSLVVVHTFPLQDIYKSRVSTEVNHRPTHCLQMRIYTGLLEGTVNKRSVMVGGKMRTLLTSLAHPGLEW